MIEAKRGCGFRRVGGLYLVGGFQSAPCDRMPLPLTVCPTCGGGLKVTRGFTQINPYQLWGPHEGQGVILEGDVGGTLHCKDYLRPCFLCDPKDEMAYIMGVGEKYYTPEAFIEEAQRLGISKRIPFIPKDLELGKTVIYLSHPKACEVQESAVLQQAMGIIEEARTMQPKLLDSDRVEKKPGIFCAFIPQRVEKLIWESEATPEELEKLEKRGITPVIVPDEDKDHAA